MDQINNYVQAEQAGTIASEDYPISSEILAEIEAQKDMSLHGTRVQKIGGCAVITVGEEVVAIEIPFTYSQLVSTIIRRKYDADQSEAIIANFLSTRTDTLSESKIAEYMEEYEAFQSYRNLAKSIAMEVMGMGPD